MMFTNIIGVMALVAVVVAHPPPQKHGYSVVTHHVEPKKVHHSEWSKQSGGADESSSWNQQQGGERYGKAASSYSSLSTGSTKQLPEWQAPQQSANSKHLSDLHAPLKPLAWSPIAISDEQKAQQQYGRDEKDSYPKYKFDYGVKDPHTGDNKKQWESRHGDVVKGAFESTNAKIGAKSLVEYKSDKHSGFLADVNSKLVKPHGHY